LPLACPRVKLAFMTNTHDKLLSMVVPKRRWTQFSLWTMFAVVTVHCVWLALQVRAANRQRAAVEGIKELAGQCFYDYQLRDDGSTHGDLPPPGSKWLRDRLGIDHFANVDCVVLWDPNRVGQALKHLKLEATSPTPVLQNSRRSCPTARLTGEFRGACLLAADRAKSCQIGHSSPSLAP
jgi:hypothetical protein